MSFVIYTENESARVENILSYEWLRDTDAACDALRLNFIPFAPFEEVRRIEAYSGGKCVFYGYVDLQRRSVSENGESEFIYARSSACLLVDNEAQQLSFNAPCVNTLFTVNALPFGFKNGLKNHSVNAEYSVGKGVSCYGAVNTFVKAFEGKSLAVSPDGTLYVPDGSSEYTVEPERVIAVTKTVKRSDAISRIDYKTDGGYIHHRKSGFAEDKKISRSRHMNMSSLPEWQRSTALSNRLKSAAQDYYSAEITVEGQVDSELYSPIRFEGFEGYYISFLHTSFSRKGTVTVIGLRKKPVLKETDYVA